MSHTTIPSAALLVAALFLAACADMSALVDTMNAESTVVYGEGGRMFVLVNRCLDAYPDTDSDGYKSCTLPEGAPWFGPADSTEEGGTASPGARVEVLEYPPDHVDQVLPWVHRFKWITVNPSMCSIRCAVWIASVQMKVMEAEGVVLVYLPQGPDRSEIMDPDTADPCDLPGEDTRENAAHRYLCGRFANDHPEFHATMSRLVEQATNPTDDQGWPVGLGSDLVVSAYSYSVPLTMEAIRDNPRVVFLAVAPSFGWQRWRGSPAHDRPRWGRICIPHWRTKSYHELRFVNPHLATWQENLATHVAPTCMYMSYGDCFSQNFDGVAMALPDREVHCNDQMPIDEHASYNHVDDLSPFRVFVLPQPPSDPGEAVFDPDHPGGWSDPHAWTVGEPGQLIGNLQNARAISANWQTVDTLRMIPVTTTTADLDRSYAQSWTRTYSEEADVGHFGYWQNGNQPPVACGEVPPEQPPFVVPPEHYTANFNFKDFICQCPSMFEPADCPACGALTDLCEGASSWFEWMLDPRDPSVDRRLGLDVEVKDNDVLWYPTARDLPEGGVAAAFADLEAVWGPTVARRSGRVGALANRVGFRMDLLPEPPERRVTRSEIQGGVGMVHQSCEDEPSLTTYRQGITQSVGMLEGHPYSELRGHWVDVELRWWDDAPGACGDEARAYTSGPHRVLLMKMEGLPSHPQPGSYRAAFVEPVPDIRNIAAPDVVCVEDGPVTVSAQAYTHPTSNLAAEGPVWGELLFAGVSEGPYPGALSLTRCLDGDCSNGRTYDYSFTFDPLIPWCRTRAFDSLCGGTERATPMGVQLRIWATNASGDPFWQTLSMGIQRCD